MFAQQRVTAEFGKPSIEDFNLKTYPKDSEATGVVLFEKGKNYVKLIKGYVRLIKEVHTKIKVLDAKNFEEATVLISFYKGEEDKERVTHLKAITHNGQVKTYLKKEAVFEINKTENWHQKRFTFPNVKDGSILEYSYQIESPYFLYFGDWEFQGKLPKIYSEFVSEMPGNYVYRRSLIGNQKLDINEVSLKKKCFVVSNITQKADCEVGLYAMYDIPAFKEEAYMLSSKNYISRLDFELKEYIKFSGKEVELTDKWSDVDKEFKRDKDLGKQLKNKPYFESKLPTGVFTLTNNLEKAKTVYYFIQDHFSWNGKQRILSDIRVKKAFEKRIGNSSEINLSLINALEAVGLNAKIVLLSTRDNGLPGRLYPVLTDFNYAIVILKIDGVDYLLDATNKLTPFGILPFKTLNSYGRVLDFKEGSYWQTIKPHLKNITYLNAQLEIDENAEITGKVIETYTGYKAITQRKELKKNDLEAYLNFKESTINEGTINNYTNENSDAIDKNFKETYNISIETETNGNTIFLYPFFLKSFYSENPFKLNTRIYPIDFGYPTSNTYLLSLDLNDLYTVSALPKNKIVKLAGEAGECSVLYNEANGKLNIRFSLKLNHYQYDPKAYESLKDFFNKVINIQTKEAVVLKKL